MNYMTKFGLSLVLGLAAAGLNWMWLSSKKTPPLYVATVFDVTQGEELSDDKLMAVPVPGDVQNLRNVLIPYEDRAIIFGTPAVRDYTVGDVVFQRDIKAPLEPAQWDVIGPFQLISVGEQFKENYDDEDGDYSATRGNNITIAVDKNFDERTSQLLEVLDANGSEKSNKDILRIVAVQVVSKGGIDGSTAKAKSNVDDVFQTVSLSGIPNVPRVLLEGDLIRFVIPKETLY